MSTTASGYDEVGNRTSMTRDATSYSYTYDDNDKLTGLSGGGQSASFGYDGAGNMTSVTGTMYQNKTMVFNDDNRLTSISYGGNTDLYTYNWEGLRTRARLKYGLYHRYLYNGQRVLQDLTDDGDWHTTYTTENGSYEGTLVGIKRYDLEQERFPLYDSIGTALGLVCELGTVTDSYDMDTFGAELDSTVTTPNPYRFGGAWGYITDPSGLLQLGARYYWPEVGRFVEQDPIGEEVNRYVYADGNPVRYVDADGEHPILVVAGGLLIGGAGGAILAEPGHRLQGAVQGGIAGTAGSLFLLAAGAPIAGALGGGAWGGMAAGGASALVGDAVGQLSFMAMGIQCTFNWPELGISGFAGGIGGAIMLRPSTAPMQEVSGWAPEGVTPDLARGRWVMTGGPSVGNYARSGVWQPGYGYPYGKSVTDTLPGSQLSYPPGWEWLKGLIGQRVVY
jgi:RHS repeat-associated protein